MATAAFETGGVLGEVRLTSVSLRARYKHRGGGTLMEM